MPELNLRCSGNVLEMTLGEYHTTAVLDAEFNGESAERIYEDPVLFGRNLFEKAFHDEQMRALLTNLQSNERLVLVAEDPLVAAIPWEYLRDEQGKLLAARINFVRGISQTKRREGFHFTDPLEIVAVPVSPVDDPRTLNVEQEWKNLVEAVTTTNSGTLLTVKRVRPPTRIQLEHTLNRRSATIFHFMGHSSSHAGEAFLALEDARGRSHQVNAADLSDSLNSEVFLVILNSCLSATVAPTKFGNIAHSLVSRGVPYALGMQFILPDDAALSLSQALYEYLLRGNSVEDTIRLVRRTLEESGKLSNPHWLAGIPVLYTSLHTPAPPLELETGKPIIQPDPEHLQKTCDLTALPKAEHFVGRATEISTLLDAFLSSQEGHGIVLLHGLGGVGKTATARAVAERIGWYYQDRVLALSFETLAGLDRTNELSINEQFADRFYHRLAKFYDLDPASYLSSTDLQQAILQRRTHLRSLLVLDNMETLIDIQKLNHPMAQSLASFLRRLGEGNGATLLTSRIVIPSEWGDCRVVPLAGLSVEAGADLFLALLPADRRHLAPPSVRRALSQRVQGHPLSIRLLAGRFADEAASDLATLLERIEKELEVAEQQTPSSLEDPNRQKTLYACLDCSIKRLTPEQSKVLDAASLFLAPFLPEFVAQVLNNEEQTNLHLEDLVLLGLLTKTGKTFPEGELNLLELHPMLRWYLQLQQSTRDQALLTRYGEVYARLAHQAHQPDGGYDQSGRMRYLVRQCLPDLEAALQYLPPKSRSSLAFHLATPYQRLGQNRRALDLYEQALEIEQELGDMSGTAVMQMAIADVLSRQGKLPEALFLYEQASTILQNSQEEREVAIVQGMMADVLLKLGKLQESLLLAEQALVALQKLEDVRAVGATQHMMGDVLRELDKPREALLYYEKALRASQELGDVREASVTQTRIAGLLEDLGKPQEARVLYEESLHSLQELGDVRAIAVAQTGIARLLYRQGQLQEALDLYRQALPTLQGLGDLRAASSVLYMIAEVLAESDQLQEALEFYERSLHSDEELEDVHGVVATQSKMADVLRRQGRLQEAQALYEQVLRTQQALEDKHGIIKTQNALGYLLKRQGRVQEALELYEQALLIEREVPDRAGEAATLHNIAQLYQSMERYSEARVAYEQSIVLEQQVSHYAGESAGLVGLALLLYQYLDRPLEAITTMEQAVAILIETGLPQDAAGHTKEDLQSKIDRMREGIASDQTTNIPAMTPEAQVQKIIGLTITVMTVAQDRKAEWREIIMEQLEYNQRRGSGGQAEVDFFSAVLDVLDGKRPTLSPNNPYAQAIAVIQEGIIASGPEAMSISKEIVQTVSNFVNAENWEATRRIVEAQQEVLFQPEVETLFEQNIMQAKTDGQERMVQLLELHLSLLRNCKVNGIEAAFAQLASVREEHLLVAQLISRSVDALLDGPHKKAAHMQYLTAMADETTDGELKELISTIELALFSQDLSQLGLDLEGFSRQAWETIVATVEAGGVAPSKFNIIINNTVAVLSSAAKQSSEWRDNLVTIRDQAVVRGDHNIVALLDAVIGLLDADGNATGLGEGLTGVYAKTWQKIVEQLSS